MRELNDDELKAVVGGFSQEIIPLMTFQIQLLSRAIGSGEIEI